MNINTEVAKPVVITEGDYKRWKNGERVEGLPEHRPTAKELKTGFAGILYPEGFIHPTFVVGSRD